MDENERKDAPQGAPEKDNIELRKSKRGGRVKKVLLIILAVIAAILILRGVGASKFKSAVMKEEEVKTVKAVTYDEGKTIEYGGRTYVYNDDVIHFASAKSTSGRVAALGPIHCARQNASSITPITKRAAPLQGDASPFSFQTRTRHEWREPVVSATPGHGRFSVSADATLPQDAPSASIS